MTTSRNHGGVTEERARLASQLGFLLQLERERRGVTQDELAVRAGVSQQSVSRFESGRRRVSTVLADELFGKLGLQLRVEVEAAGSHLDTAIEQVRAALAVRQSMVFADLRLLQSRNPATFGYLLDGAAAALLQGVPIAAGRIDLLIAQAEVDVLAEWIRRAALLRRDERSREFTRYDVDPREPGPLWWGNRFVQLKVRLVPELPAAVLVTVAAAGGDEHRVPVRALPEVEVDFPAVARVLRRLRAAR